MMCSTGVRTKLCMWSVAFAFGVTKGLGLLFLALAGYFHGYGMDLINMISSLYYGYGATVAGGFYGLLWGFIDGFICGLVFAAIYNLCICCGCKKDKDIV